MAEVFAAYETVISLSPLEQNVVNEVLNDNIQLEINNYGNKKVFPCIKIIAMNGNFELNAIINNEQKIIFEDLELDDNGLIIENEDELLLDFNKQIYKVNDESIIENINFVNNKRLFLKENEINYVDFECAGDANIEIEYSDYSEEKENLCFIESFRIDKTNNYEQVMPFRGEKPTGYDLINCEYAVSIEKLSSDWIDSKKEYRINYSEDNWDTGDKNSKYLLGVVFTENRRGFNQSDGILQDGISGEALSIINKKGED